MAADYNWLTEAGVIELNRIIIAASEDKGERHGVLNEGNLGGALARPQQQLYYGDPEPDLLDLAVSYMVSVGQAHAFENGNKRTGFAAGKAFLEMNGFTIGSAYDKEYFAALLEKVILKDAEPETYVDEIAPYIVPLPPPEETEQPYSADTHMFVWVDRTKD